MILLAAVWLGVAALQSHANTEMACRWCVSGDAKATKEVVSLAKLPPKKLLSEVRAHGVCVRIIGARHTTPAPVFSWGHVQKSDVPIGQVTRFSTVMGKMLCKGELPIAKACDTIFLAQDAPYSILLREYVHYIQAKRDEKWCTGARERWSRGSTHQEWVEIREKEWDAAKVLWENRNQMAFAREDKIDVATTLLNEAQERNIFDPQALDYVKSQKVESYLQETLNEHHGK